MKECETCSFWEQLEEHIGECRKNAPTPLWNTLYKEKIKKQEMTENACWPSTFSSDWCGEYKGKK